MSGLKKVIFYVIISVVILMFLMYLVLVTFYKKEYESDVNTYAKMYSLDVDLVYAVINTESGFNVNAKSKAGAMGLMQLLPTTAKDVAIRIGMEYSEDMLFRPNTNIHLGCYYLKYLIDMFGSVELGLASYNAGLSYVRSWLKDSRYSNNGVTLDYIPFKETREYVFKVKVAYFMYKYFR